MKANEDYKNILVKNACAGTWFQTGCSCLDAGFLIHISM